jgi:hypothetical protein
VGIEEEEERGEGKRIGEARHDGQSGWCGWHYQRALLGDVLIDDESND